jgi:hypothetical protein
MNIQCVYKVILNVEGSGHTHNEAIRKHHKDCCKVYSVLLWDQVATKQGVSSSNTSVLSSILEVPCMNLTQINDYPD